jgi:two-component system, NtrC family, sensor kinase
VQHKLTTKFAIASGIVLLLIMTLFATFNIKSLKDLYLQEAIKDADNLGDTILRTTHYQMLENDRERVYKMIEEVSEQKGVENIRLLDKDGIIDFSTEKTEVGTRVDSNIEGCNGCHAMTIPLTDVPSSARSRIFINAEGDKILGVTKEINNKESCYTAACHFHPKEASLLGVLDVHVSLEEMEVKIANSRNEIIMFTLALMLILSLCLSFMIQRFINRPVIELLQHTQKLTRGHLSSRIPIRRKDELGKLANAFNDMTENLQEAQNELKSWGTTLEHKVDERTREIEQMQAQLIQSAKLASLGEFVAGIAHEINNPLTGILMFSSLVNRDPRLHLELKANMETVMGETKRCAKIVQNLLEFSRNTPPEKESKSIHEILDHTLSLTINQNSFRKIELVKNYAKDVPDIPVDPAQMEQVFMNMIINAEQAMPDGGSLIIETEKIQPDTITIKLKDTGKGIPEESIEKIFDPFFTTKGRQQGTGLGLSISYGIIKCHGGQINVESSLGKGTIFSISLPINPERDDNSPAEPEEMA